MSSSVGIPIKTLTSSATGTSPQQDRTGSVVEHAKQATTPAVPLILASSYLLHIPSPFPPRPLQRHVTRAKQTHPVRLHDPPPQRSLIPHAHVSTPYPSARTPSESRPPPHPKPRGTPLPPPPPVPPFLARGRLVLPPNWANDKPGTARPSAHTRLPPRLEPHLEEPRARARAERRAAPPRLPVHDGRRRVDRVARASSGTSTRGCRGPATSRSRCRR